MIAIIVDDDKPNTIHNIACLCHQSNPTHQILWVQSIKT